MGVRCSEITKYIEEFAPAHLAEDWDNVGLLLGNYENEIKRVMVCLDITSKIAEDAVKKQVDLIVSHHPLIFKGFKRINENDPKGKIIYKLIKNDINIYCAHTNFDVAEGGMNNLLAGLLELKQVRNLKSYKTEKLYKVVVFVPEESVDRVRDSMSSAGAGWIGNYSDCSFMVKGIGTFRPLKNTNPYIGKQGNLEKVDEFRLETIVPQKNLSRVIGSMIDAHPYEEVAYDIYPLQLKGKEYGLGKVGMLDTPVTFDDFIRMVKSRLDIKNVRVIGSVDNNISKVAVFCGSFDESWADVIREGADILVTGDIKYHTALDIIEMGLCVIDAGHFNTEKIMVSRMAGILKERFSKIEVISNDLEEDPFKIY